METEAMYEGRDVACMMPRIFDRTSCRMPGSVRKSMLAGAIRYGIAYRADSTGSDMDGYLRRLTTRFFGESVWELYNIN